MGSPLTPALRALAGGHADDAVTELSLVLLDLPDGAEARAMPLHVLAAVELGRATADAPRVLLAEAAAVERAAGHEVVALHTSHQLALMTQAGTSLAKVGAYYRETFETLTRMGNAQGAALCLKSMAALYLAHGKDYGALTLLQRSEKLLLTSGDGAAAHVAGWVSALSPR